MAYNYPPGGGYYGKPPPPNYQQQVPQQHHHTVVIQQPVIVQPKQPSVRHQTDDFFSSLGKAVDSVATDISREISSATATTASAVYNPLSLLKAGYVVRITSKVYGKCLRILENGVADCEGGIGTASEFLVLSAGPQTSIIRLRNMALPQFHLAIVNGYLVGYGQGGSESDFIPAMTSDSYITFESASSPGSHIGVLPSGQITSPAQTNKLTDASHFKITYLRTSTK